MAISCKYGDESAGSGGMELVSLLVIKAKKS
jgi:hypothetical protein